MAKTKVFRKKTLKKSTRKSITSKKRSSHKQYCKYGRKKNRKSHKKGGLNWQRIEKNRFINAANEYNSRQRIPVPGTPRKTTAYNECMKGAISVEIENAGATTKQQYCDNMFLFH
tara:strand:- start:32 stop:376 length:345 start_codon:yes stop_codon:yes gene_type:complete